MIMSLLDDARRLAEQISDRPLHGYIGGHCFYCGASLAEDDAPDCPWLAFPRIVQALEAAERMAAVVAAESSHHAEDVRLTVDGQGTYSWCASCDLSWPCQWSKMLKEHRALVTALGGGDAEDRA